MDIASLFLDSDLIDATHTFSATTPIWPNNTKLLRCPTGGDNYNAEAYVLSGGCGTHTDAPLHFKKGMKSISDLEQDDLVSPLVLIDATKQCSQNHDYALSKADILLWEAENGTIPNGAFVAMRSGWSSRWHSEQEFQNFGSDGQMHFPGFSGEAAHFLIEERDIHAIGIDTLSLDIGMSMDFIVHITILGAGKYQVENMDLRDSRIPAKGAWIIASPMKLKDAPEAPTRVLIVVPKK